MNRGSVRAAVLVLAMLPLALSSGCECVAGVEERTLGDCAPGTARCEDGARQICIEEGKRWEEAPCSAEHPTCAGAGQCVECGPDGTTFPDQVADDCQVIQCISGQRTSVADDQDFVDVAGDCQAVSCVSGKKIVTPVDDQLANVAGDCQQVSCVAGKKIVTPADDDFVDVVGDCQHVSCVSGTKTVMPAGDDFVDDEDACTHQHCESGQVVVEPSAGPGAPCALWQGNPGEFGCARDTSGGVRCWGRNSMGQLGNGVQDLDNPPQQYDAGPLVGLPDAARSLALGIDYACALLVNGQVYCWGNNDYGKAQGQLGEISASPFLIALPSAALQVATGAQHTCALLEDTSVQCWGENLYGQLGDGTHMNNRATPAPVMEAEVTALTGVKRLALQARTSCALMTRGHLKCWGKADSLGDGGVMEDPDRLYPVSVFAGVDAVSAGTGHTCAITTTGKVHCWGLNWYGQTGDALTQSSPPSMSPTPHLVDLQSTTLQVAAGFHHTCSRHAGGVRCWGGDFWAQLGDGDQDDCANSGESDACKNKFSATAVPVTGLGPVDDIAIGYIHSCAVAQGAVYCWGSDHNGQLGNGFTVGTAVPGPVLWP